MSDEPSVRLYPTGFGPRAEARYPWPADCSLQGGRDGIVLSRGSLSEALTDPGKGAEALAAAIGVVNPPGSYRTAFFEAFPRSPATFLRGEGATLEAAEDDCWRQWQRIQACPGHDYERRDYRHGAGICRHCGLFSTEAFDTTLDPCVVCGAAAGGSTYGQDRHGRYHCKKCYRLIPEDDKSEMHRLMDRMLAEDRAPSEPAQ